MCFPPFDPSKGTDACHLVRPHLAQGMHVLHQLMWWGCPLSRGLLWAGPRMLCPGPYSRGGDGSRPTVPVMQIGSCWGRKAPLSYEGGGCTKMVAPDVCVQGLAQGVRGLCAGGSGAALVYHPKTVCVLVFGNIGFPNSSGFWSFI